MMGALFFLLVLGTAGQQQMLESCFFLVALLLELKTMCTMMCDVYRWALE
jgi:hypothetical protein